MTDTATGMTHDFEELRIYSNGHKIHRRVFEKVDAPGFEDGWYKDYYYQEYTKLTSNCMIGRIDGEVFSVSAYDLHHSCAECDEWVSLEYRDGAAYMKGEPCALQDGITTVVEIDVPSGRLICDDSLRDAEGFDWEDGDKASYNTTLGQAQVVEELATRGLLFAPCGNSCPGMWEIEPGKYAVANAEWNEDDDDSEEETKPL